MGLILLNINSLLRDFSKTFYTEPLMVILNVLFLILAVKIKLRDKKYRIFILYGVAALLQDMISIGVNLIDLTMFELGNFGITLINTVTILFIQIEFVVFYRFFYWQFEDQEIQKKIQIGGNIITSLSLICSCYFIFFTPYKIMHFFSDYLSAIFSVLQLIPAFYYFYTLFKYPPVKNLLRESSFWITTGIAFLNGLNIPLFLVNTYVMYRFNPIWFHLYTINFIAYCFLFTLFTISLLCDKLIQNDIPYNESSVGLNN